MFLGYNPTSGIARSKGSSIFILLRKIHAVCLSGCTSPHCHQQHTRVPFSLQPGQHFFFNLVMMAIQTGMKWYIFVVLICISLMGSDAEYPFICLWVLCMSSLEKCLFRSFTHFWLDCLSSWSGVLWVLYILWRSGPCPRYHRQLFSHMVGSLFILMMVSLAVQKLFSLM